jgi:hypothetical protein
MKKIFLFTAIAVLTLSSCKKEGTTLGKTRHWQRANHKQTQVSRLLKQKFEQLTIQSLSLSFLQILLLKIVTLLFFKNKPQWKIQAIYL